MLGYGAHPITSLACGSLPTWPDMTRYLIGSCSLTGHRSSNKILSAQKSIVLPCSKIKSRREHYPVWRCL